MRLWPGTSEATRCRVPPAPQFACRVDQRGSSDRLPMLRHLLAIAPLLLAPAIAQTSAIPADITWHQDFTAARALAKQAQVPLLVTFRCEA